MTGVQTCALPILKDGNPELMMEIKSSDPNLDKNLIYFNKRYQFPGVQLVGDLRLEKDSGNLIVRRLLDYLSNGLGKEV